MFEGPDGIVMTKRYSLQEIGEVLPDSRWPGWVGLWEDDWVDSDGDTLFMLSPEARRKYHKLCHGSDKPS